MHPTCRPLLAAALLCLSAARAAETDAAALKKLEDLLAVPNWNVTATLGAGGGYRDNVLLSATQPTGSGFARGNLDAMLLRRPAAGVDGYAFLSAEETRYFSKANTDHERAWFLVMEPRWQSTDAWKVGLPVQAYQVEQVVDVSTTQAELDTALLKVTGVTVGPTARWRFHEVWWTEAKATGRQDHFAGDVDGYLESEGSLRLGRTWKNGSELSLGGATRDRDHDARLQYSLGGRPLAGTHLKFRQHEASAHWNFVPDEKKSWRAQLDAMIQQNRDNGTGYFDYNEWKLSGGLKWRTTAWDADLSATVAHYDFPNQLVGIGIAPDTRHKDDFQAELSVIHHLSSACGLKASYQWERAASNDDRSRFRNSSIYLGLQWDWDSLATTSREK